MKMPIRVRRLPLIMSIALLAGFLSTACRPAEPPPAPTPKPVCPQGKAPSTQAELDACLQGRIFDSSEQASDHQPLTIIESVRGPSSLPCPGDATEKLGCRYGPLASIQPIVGAQRYTEEDLRQGRIIARLSIPAGQKEGYRKYGLVPGQNTYWWVQTDTSGTRGTSVFITRGQDGKLQQEQRPLEREIHDADYYKRFGLESSDYDEEGRRWRATARWLWELEDETATSKCGSGSCK